MLAGRSALDRRADVVERHQQADAGRDLEVGGVDVGAAQDALGDPVVDSLQRAGQSREVGADVVVVGLLRRAAAAMIGAAVLVATLSGTPSFAPSP